MPRTSRRLLAFLSLALLVGLPLGCSDDDPTTPGTNPPADQTAPLVVNIAPGDHDTGVAVDQAVVVYFSEAMDEATAVANLGIQPGGLSDLVWNDDSTQLSIQHAVWSEGIPITVTIGAGMTDVAGNTLPQAFSAQFYTDSATPALMDVMLPGGADAMLTNGDPVYLFSEPMDLMSVYNNTVITQAPPKAVPEYQVGNFNGDPMTLEIKFLSSLDPLSTYTITIGADALTQSGSDLGFEIVTTFTTGADADETGPQILSVVPAMDAVVPTDLESITVTFTEPINIGNMRVAEMSALLEFFMAREPVWNATYDEMTIYLQRPLPEGVRLYAIFDEYDLEDLVGNPNAEVDSLSFSTAGTASLFPVREDLKIYYSASIEGPNTTARQTLENFSGENFDRVVDMWSGTGYDELFDNWQMSMGASGLLLLGTTGDEGPTTFNPGLDFLHLPLDNDWAGSSTGTSSAGTITLAYEAEWDGPYREEIYLDFRKSYPGSLILEDCVRVTIDYTITPTGETLPVEIGEIITSYAPGLGIYGQELYGYEYDGLEVIDSWEDDFWVLGASLDDRWEIPR